MNKVVVKYKTEGDGKMKSVYLKFSPPIRDKQGISTEYEFLNIELFANPANSTQRKHNENVKAVAEAIQCERYLQIVRHDFSFLAKDTLDGDFLRYIEDNTDYRGIKYKSARIQFERFCNGHCKFGDVNTSLMIKFKGFLLTNKKNNRKKALAHNTAATYLNCILDIAKMAYKDNILSQDPTSYVYPIPWEHDTHKQYLTESEINKLRNTPFEEEPEVRKAGLFSIDTGLRRSDILNVRWEQIDYSESRHPYLVIKIHKTGNEIRLPLSRNAIRDIEPIRNEGLIFPNLTIKLLNSMTRKWLLDARIYKHITFHCFRTTFAMRLINKGADIFTISHLMGHKSVASTQIYARIAPKKAQDAISLLD